MGHRGNGRGAGSAGAVIEGGGGVDVAVGVNAVNEGGGRCVFEVDRIGVSDLQRFGALFVAAYQSHTMSVRHQ